MTGARETAAYLDSVESALNKTVKSSLLTGQLSNEFSFFRIKDEVESQLVAQGWDGDIAYQLISRDERLVAGNWGRVGERVADRSDIRQAISAKEERVTRELLAGEPVLVYTVPLVFNNEVQGVLRVIASLDRAQYTFGVFSFSVFFVKPVLIGLLLLIAFVFAGLRLADVISRPFVQMVDFAQGIAAGHYSLRVAENQYGEAKVLAQTLNRMAGQIERLDRLKDVFLASISHELKTPLTSIRGWSVTLNNSKHLQQERLQMGLRMIEMESDRLSRLVEQLLDFSSYVSGNRIYMPSQVHVKDFLQETVEQFHIQTQERKVNVKVQAEGADRTVELDRDKIKQVLINVLDNALKFTPAGGHITIRSIVDDTGTLRCTVADTGCGIKPDDLNEVVKQFYKADPESGGNGLGLTICKQIMELHGGDLMITSVYGEGTTVEFVIPPRTAGGEPR